MFLVVALVLLGMAGLWWTIEGIMMIAWAVVMIVRNMIDPP